MTNPSKPAHLLSSIEARLTIPLPHEPQTQALVVHGRSTTRRSNLWTYQELWDLELAQVKGYGPADALAHIAMVCTQDQPNSLDRLEFGLSGGLAYQQDPMF